jgi:hypothetical protein
MPGGLPGNRQRLRLFAAAAGGAALVEVVEFGFEVFHYCLRRMLASTLQAGGGEGQGGDAARARMRVALMDSFL